MDTRLSSLLLTLLLLVTGFQTTTQAQVRLGDASVSPDPSAMLDVSSTTKGFLAPRMNEAQRLAIATPPEGLMVYQTNAAIGYWYYDSNVGGWINVFRGSQPWTIEGNTGTNAATQYLGTSNSQPLAFGTNGSEVARFETNGRFRLGGTAGPTQQMHVEGAVKMTGTSAANTQGAIRWDATNSTHEGNVDGTATGWYPLENVLQEKNPAVHYVQAAPACAVPPSGYVQIGAGTGATVGTVETPWGTLWEDNKVQFMWLAADLAANNICPNEDITAVSFNGIVTGTAYNQDRAELGMLQTTATDLAAGFESGTINLWAGNNFVPVNGWNQFNFSTPFQWNGTSNLVVEYAFDNCDWGTNQHVATDATSYAALYGMFCDACGGTGFNTCTGGVTCPYEAANHTPACSGAGDGLVGGLAFDNSTNTATCDGCGTWPGNQGPANKRPQLRFYCRTGVIPAPVAVNDRVLWYNGGLIVGDGTWATQLASAGTLPSVPANFRGPGTIVAQEQVWGGGTLLSDYVFDIYFDGEARSEDAYRASEYQHLSVQEMAEYAQERRHLPTIDGREEWDRTGQFSVDKLNNQMWVTVEEQALYIKELNERMSLLQEHLLKKQMAEMK